MDPGPFETIQGQRFSVWRGEPNSTGVTKPGWDILALTAFWTYCMFLGSAYLLRNPDVSGPGVMVVALIVLYGPMLLVPLARRRSREKQTAPLAPGPPRSIPITLIRSSGNGGLGRSRGWIWTDGPWLRFRGEHFDFDLRREDLMGHRPLRANQNVRWGLKLPSGYPPLAIGAIAMNHLTERGRIDRANTIKLNAELKAWGTRGPARGSPLLPPIGHHIERPSPLAALRDWPALGLVVAITWAMNVPLFPPGTLQPEVIWLLPAAAIFAPLSVPMAIAAEELNARSYEKKLRKVRGN